MVNLKKGYFDYLKAEILNPITVTYFYKFMGLKLLIAQINN